MSLPTVAVLLCALALGACGEDDAEEATTASAERASAAREETTKRADIGVLEGTLPLLNGEPQDLAAYRGKVVLVVNTASECGYAPQFEGLEALYRDRRDDGLVILGFPADDVVGQEPRSDEEIAEFCEANYGVSFPMFSKSNVVDDPVNPLYVSLSESLGGPTYNFNKYLLDRRGRPIQRYDQSTEPDDPELTRAIEQLL